MLSETAGPKDCSFVSKVVVITLRNDCLQQEYRSVVSCCVKHLKK